MTTDPLEPYRPYIDNFDLTEEQKLELVNAIVHIAEVVLDKRLRAFEQQKIPDDK